MAHYVTIGYYRITGRVDDVVSGHNLGYSSIEDAINEHPAVAEMLGFPHDVKRIPYMVL
jgi:acyl-coenzyme A synthetase/AMP-(fatty) acid ligase